MKYKVGDKVRIKSLDWFDKHKNNYGNVVCGNLCLNSYNKHWCGMIVTIEVVHRDCYLVNENDAYWNDIMIEGLVEETKPEFKVGDKITNGNVQLTILKITSDKYIVEDNFGECGTLYFNTRGDWKLVEEETLIKLTGEAIKNNEMVVSVDEWILPDGYIFKDENGNVIEATKIVLEKKKPKYPKTYEECSLINGDENRIPLRIIGEFTRLINARNAYWKIAGDEMGLGKPWEPNYNSLEMKYTIEVIENKVVVISTISENHILAFPTAEMRDAFYENFKDLIEECKELL